MVRAEGDDPTSDRMRIWGTGFLGEAPTLASQENPRPRHDLSGTAIGLPIRPDPQSTTPGLIGSPRAVPLVVFGLDEYPSGESLMFRFLGRDALSVALSDTVEVCRPC